MDLNAFELVDIYFGTSAEGDFCDIKVEAGAGAPRQPAPSELMPELDVLRARCENQFRECGRPEFRVVYEGTLYRVTCLEEYQSSPVDFLAIETLATRYAAASLEGDDAHAFVRHIRRMLSRDAGQSRAPVFITASRVRTGVYPFHQLGLPKAIRSVVLSPDARGLILFVGPMSSGKTSSAVSTVVARLQRLGGQALSLEDPIETLLDGLHGEGRCKQIEISRHDPKGYEEQFMVALRKRIGTIHVSEIRDNDMAERVLRFACSDHLLVSTLHADSAAGAVEHLFEAATSRGSATAAGQLARGLTAVVYQRLVRDQNGIASIVPECLSFVDPEDREQIRTIIRDRAFDRLEHVQKDQQRRNMHAPRAIA